MEDTRTAEELTHYIIAEILFGSSRNLSWRGTKAFFMKNLGNIFVYTIDRIEPNG
jgi:hypothetical protein